MVHNSSCLFSLIIFFLKKKIKEINKFLVILSWCFFALFLYRIVTTIPPNINLENLEITQKKLVIKKLSGYYLMNLTIISIKIMLSLILKILVNFHQNH